MSNNEFNKELYDEKIKNLENDSKEYEKRITALEKIYITIEKMANELVALRKDTNSINSRLTAIEKEPADKWKQVSSYVLTAIIGAVISFILVKLGLK